MKKLMIFGDSILKGVIYSEEKKGYKRCEDYNFKSFENYGISAVNYSRMGATISYGAASAERHIDEIDKDTIVIMEYGGNDCDYDWDKISENPDGEMEPHTPEKKFTEIYTETAEKILRKTERLAIANIVPLEPTRYFSWISRNLNGENILKWLGDVTMLGRYQEHYSRLDEEIAGSVGCKVFDLRRLFLTRRDYSELICFDGIHPSQKGHEIIHEAILKFCMENFQVG